MDSNEIFEKLLDHFGSDQILGQTEAAEGIRDPFITVAPKRIDKICLYLRVEPGLEFDFCQSLTCIDAGESLTCVYHLYSYPHRATVVLKTSVPRAEPRLPTCVGVWPVTNWYEREAYDLFGMDFVGHPDLRRLLLPSDWPGHPGLKDWTEPESYRGIPTRRDNPLDLLDEPS